MKKKIPLLALGAIAVAATSFAARVEDTAVKTAPTKAPATTVRVEPIKPIAAPKVGNLAMVELGKQLYFDPRLSKSGYISCNSCHNLSMGGTDNLKTSIGHGWQPGKLNAPTVLNSSLAIAQFWDGRADNLEQQAGGPIANPAEMGMPHELAVKTLETIPGYREAFWRVFRTERITIDEVTKAIAAFEETLVTPNSRFDRWLKGDERAINEQELRGWKLFKGSGCVACHNGPAAGGTSFQKLGLMQPYKGDTSAEGRAAVTHKDADRFKFKVPTLRNVELTYPYFHDGEAKTLAEAVEIMGKIQLGRTFSKDENADIVAFLKTLTGDAPAFRLPQLPPSGPNTPAPMPFDVVKK